MTYHEDLTDPADIHVTRGAATAKPGMVLRYDGLGGEAPAAVPVGHLDLVLGVAGNHTLTDLQASYASLRISGVDSTDRTILVPTEWGPVLVENAFASEQSLQVGTLLGVKVAIPKGQRQLVVCRGGDAAGFLAVGRGGAYNINVEGLDDYDMTAADLMATYLRFTGLPNANLTLYVPESWTGVIENAMTGTNTLTVSRESGGTTITVLRGRPVWLQGSEDAMLSLIPAVLQGQLDIDVAGLAAHSLTDAQKQARFLRFTGDLTQACVVTIPDTHGPFTVENATTGAYTLTLQRTSGGTTKELLQGYTAELVARTGGIVVTAPEAPLPHQDISVAGLTTYTLTALQARASSLRFTGALTGNCVVTVPDTWGPVALENATTGAYTLTFQRASGGTALALTQTKIRLMLARSAAVLALTPEV